MYFRDVKRRVIHHTIERISSSSVTVMFQGLQRPDLHVESVLPNSAALVFLLFQNMIPKSVNFSK